MLAPFALRAPGRRSEQLGRLRPALRTRSAFMQSTVLVCGCIHVDQVDVLALNEHLCAVGSDRPGDGSWSTGGSSYIR